MSTSFSVLPRLQGAIVWAVVAYQEEAPFEVEANRRALGKQSSSWIAHRVSLPRKDPQRLIQPFDLVAKAKVRPIVLLQDRPQGRLPEYAALKLTRLEKYDEKKQQEIRHQPAGAPFFYLKPGRSTLKNEFAIDLLSLVRVHESAIVTKKGKTEIVGRLDANEFRVVCERLVDLLDLDLANLAAREARTLLTAGGWERSS